MRANNDPSDENFATLTDVLSNEGQINFSNSASIGQARCNHDHFCGHEKVVGRKNGSIEPNELGTFHRLPVETRFFIACCNKASSASQNEFAKALKCQRTARAAKAKLIADKKLRCQTSSY